MRYRWLNFHLPYACRHSGACCGSGWPIPVEQPSAAAIERRVAGGEIKPLLTPWLTRTGREPEGIAGVLAARAQLCVFRHGDRCAVYADRPQSCVHFPFVCLVDARGVHVTLSHYCPTAASLLFEHHGPIEIVDGPAPIHGRELPEGLDARESLPPRASASRLMSFDDLSRWEHDRIQELAGAPVPGFDEALAPIVRRYLAAKLFGSWAAYTGDGTEAVMDAVARARNLLTEEVAKQRDAASRPIDSVLLKEAIRQTDFQLLHCL